MVGKGGAREGSGRKPFFHSWTSQQIKKVLDNCERLVPPRFAIVAASDGTITERRVINFLYSARLRCQAEEEQAEAEDRDPVFSEGELFYLQIITARASGICKAHSQMLANIAAGTPTAGIQFLLVTRAKADYGKGSTADQTMPVPVQGNTGASLLNNLGSLSVSMLEKLAKQKLAELHSAGLSLQVSATDPLN